jgi:hypothetical protein
VSFAQSFIQKYTLYSKTLTLQQHFTSAKILVKKLSFLTNFYPNPNSQMRIRMNFNLAQAEGLD